MALSFSLTLVWYSIEVLELIYSNYLQYISLSFITLNIMLSIVRVLNRNSPLAFAIRDSGADILATALPLNESDDVKNKSNKKIGCQQWFVHSQMKVHVKIRTKK